MNTHLLTAILKARGLDNPDGVTRAARITGCPDCHTAILRGLDGDRCALAATAQPTEIDAIGEYIAKRIGLITYTLRRSFNAKGGQIWTLDPRFQWEIAAQEESIILAQHRCGLQIPPAKTPRADRIYPPRTTTVTDHPPY